MALKLHQVHSNLKLLEGLEFLYFLWFVMRADCIELPQGGVDLERRAFSSSFCTGSQLIRQIFPLRVRKVVQNRVDNH